MAPARAMKNRRSLSIVPHFELVRVIMKASAESLRNVHLTSKSGREASLLKESAKCHKRKSTTATLTVSKGPPLRRASYAAWPRKNEQDRLQFES